MATTLHFPPLDGERWRILLTRYDYERTGSKRVELSAWTPTNSSSFHVPAKFGSITFSSHPVVAVEGPDDASPFPFTITNYPNPFNPTTIFTYQLPAASQVNLAIYDLLGRELAVLVNERKGPGRHDVTFDASALTSGVYLYRVTAGAFSQSRKMIVVR
jgi:hypothetical protein